MPATVQPVIVTPSIPLSLAFYKALLGAVEISRVPEDGPAFYVGLRIGNAELGVWPSCRSTYRRRIQPGTTRCARSAPRENHVPLSRLMRHFRHID